MQKKAWLKLQAADSQWHVLQSQLYGIPVAVRPDSVPLNVRALHVEHLLMMGKR